MTWKAPNKTHSALILAALTASCLLPFAGKAFHIDDPLFIWCARHVKTSPLACYDFSVNWYGHEESMAAVTKNPPLTIYYMALGGALLGWSETALHLWFFLPALALVLGTWKLAHAFCENPFAAALITLTAPVFILSSSSVMCDTSMVACWVWAAHFWVTGLAKFNPGRLCAAACLVAAAGLAKYFGWALLPLLLVYSLAERRRAGTWLAWLLIPVIVILGYEGLTHHLYGQDLLRDAAGYSVTRHGTRALLESLLTGPAFAGGCLVIVALLAPFLWSKKGLVAFAAALPIAGFMAMAEKNFGHFQLVEAGRINWLFLVQFSCAITAGASLIIFSILDWWKNRTPASLLLTLWVCGTFLFACGINWTVSGRNFLPMLPAAAILIIRRLESRYLGGPAVPRKLVAPLTISLAIAMIAGWADFDLAASARDAAATILRPSNTDPAHVWFDGHWGFQYYMEQAGARPIDSRRSQIFPQDVIATPVERNSTVYLPMERLQLFLKYDGASFPWLTTMSYLNGAGYYASECGPLPFAICRSQTNDYAAFRMQ